MENIISVKNLVKTFQIGDQELHALNGVSFDVRDGEFTAIMGPSGSGKSTMLNLLGCLDQPTSGSYRFDNEEVKELNSGQLVKIRRHKIGFIFQDFNLLPRLSALKNVELPLIYQGYRPKARQSKAREMLNAVGLERRINHKPTQLSGGEKQRVAIARALVSEPRIILADEPTGNLDSETGEEILKLLTQIHKERKVTIIMITHDSHIAKSAQRIIYLKDGKIREKGILEVLHLK
ncbi:MAG TPA: ABC transporter ATP-binding protein [Patescibacteria group bacterium]|nr:ABC transporter ATP-binding protein [Patescibacteria group bacterium]